MHVWLLLYLNEQLYRSTSCMFVMSFCMFVCYRIVQKKMDYSTVESSAKYNKSFLISEVVLKAICRENLSSYIFNTVTNKNCRWLVSPEKRHFPFSLSQEEKPLPDYASYNICTTKKQKFCFKFVLLIHKFKHFDQNSNN